MWVRVLCMGLLIVSNEFYQTNPCIFYGDLLYIDVGNVVHIKMMTMNFDNLTLEILENLNTYATTIVTGVSLSSPRAVGDAVQEYLAKTGLPMVLENYGINVKSDFSRRSMEDIAFHDNNGNYYAIDVKTHNTGTKFNMPNLISVKRLANFYKTETNHFYILIVSYGVSDGKLAFTSCHFKPIESFDWGCLTLGALGWGQIQITNANNLQFNEMISRGEWMNVMCERLNDFYTEELKKINERKVWFENYGRND